MCFSPIALVPLYKMLKQLANSAKIFLPKGVTYGSLTETSGWLTFALPSPHTLNFVATLWVSKVFVLVVN